MMRSPAAKIDVVKIINRTAPAGPSLIRDMMKPPPNPPIAPARAETSAAMQSNDAR